MALRSIALACGVLLLAASARPITLPGGRGAPSEPRARTFVVAPSEDEGGPPPDAEPHVQKVTVTGEPSILRVSATIDAGRAPIAVVQRDGKEVARGPLTSRYAAEWSATFDATPGDYRVIVTDGGSRETSDVMARSIPCARGERHLVVQAIGPGTLVRRGSEPALVIPRWQRQDQEYSYVVEWLRDGKLVYETRGRTDHLQKHVSAIQGMHGSTSFDHMCAYSFGEHYTAPKLTEGAWEARVHREGAESVTSSFVVAGRERDIELQFSVMPTPRKAAALLAGIPRACTGAYKLRDLAGGEQSDWYGWEGCGAVPSGTGMAVPVTVAEYRALMRDAEVFEIRSKMSEMIGQYGPVARPDFEYDSEKSPDTNWHRHKAWDKVDTDRAFANERILASRARAKHGAALRARVSRYGGDWRPDEIPAPMPNWPAH
jgi:hypothetical protein